MFKCFCCPKKPKSIMDRINSKPKNTNFFGCRMSQAEKETQKEMISDIFKDITTQEIQPK